MRVGSSALLNAEFTPHGQRAWRWVAEGPAPRTVVKFELLTDQGDIPGEATFGHSLRSLLPGGTVVVAGETTGWNPPAELNRVFARQLRVVGSTMGTRGELVDLLRFLRDNALRPPIDVTVPLGDARFASARMAEGEQFGKVVLTT